MLSYIMQNARSMGVPPQKPQNAALSFVLGVSVP